MILDAGKVDFYKFVDGGWKGSWILGQKDGTTRVAYISGTSASFAFPLDADGDGAAGKSLSDLQLSIVMRSVAPNQRLSVFANEKPVTTLEVSKERAAYDPSIETSVYLAPDEKGKGLGRRRPHLADRGGIERADRRTKTSAEDCVHDNVGGENLRRKR